MLPVYTSLADKQQYYTCYRANSVEEIKTIFKNASSYNCVFRGVKDAKFRNYSSAQVNTDGTYSAFAFSEAIKESIRFARKSVRVNKALSRLSLDDSDFQVLALLQHYGFGTSVLDFTYKANFAVFFALDGLWIPKTDDEESIDNFASIYYFSLDYPEHTPIQDVFASSIPDLRAHHDEAKREYGKLYGGISQQTYNSYRNVPYDEIANVASGGVTIGGRNGGSINISDSDTGIFVSYDISNNRSDIQNGLFKFNPSNCLPYEEVAKNHYSQMPNHIYCIDFPKTLKDELAEEFLIPYNINSSTVYPNSKQDRKLIRELLKLPVDRNLRPRRKPEFMSVGTWKKLQRIYEKRMHKLGR